MHDNTPIRIVREKGPLGPMKFRFTVRQLDQIKPGLRQVWVYDTAAAGLAMLTTPAGAKTYYLAKRMEGRYRRVKIGSFPGVTIEQARRIAQKLVGEVAGGHNPAEARRIARDATTFGVLFEYYMTSHAKVHKRTWQSDQARFDKYLKPWVTRRLDQIKRQDVAALHAKIGKQYPIGANRVLATISKLFNVAADIGFTGANPARGIKRFAESERGRYLDANELPRFIEELDAEINPIIRDFYKTLLFTGQRKGNVASMQWGELDLSRQVWTIPAEKFKTAQEVEIPLTRQTLEILKNRQRSTTSPWVFPNRRRNPKCPHICEPGDAMKRVCLRAGIKGLRPHDLRRTLASWATTLGVPYPVVARMIGHRVSGVTGVYARFDLTAVRDAFGRTVDAMTAAKLDNSK